MEHPLRTPQERLSRPLPEPGPQDPDGENAQETPQEAAEDAGSGRPAPAPTGGGTMASPTVQPTRSAHTPSTRHQDQGTTMNDDTTPTDPSAEGRALMLPEGGDVAPLARAPEADPLTAYMAGLGTNSRRTMLVALNRVAALFGTSADAVPWHLLKHQHVAAIRSQLADEYTAATANASLSALKGVLRSAWRLGLLDTDTFHRAIDVSGVRGSRLPTGRALDAKELRRLIRACTADETAAGRRDGALIALLGGAGLRRAEAAALAVDAYDPTDQCVVVVGKGDKERRTYFVRNGAELVDAWLEVRGREPGPLLLPVNRLGEIAHTPAGITPQALMLRVQRRAQQAGLGRLTPHDLRRSYITALLDAGADPLSVKRLVGHESLQTTVRYDLRPDRAAKDAARAVSL